MSNTIKVDSKELKIQLDKVRKATVANEKWNRTVNLFAIDGGTLKMMCGSIDFFVSCEMDCVATGHFFNDKMFEVCVDAIALSKCIGKKGETVFSIDGDKLVVESNGETSSIKFEPLNDYNIEHKCFPFERSTTYTNFTELMKNHVLFSAGVGGTRIKLEHVSFEHDGESVALFSSDGFRLLNTNYPSTCKTETFAILAEYLKVIAEIYKGCKEVHSWVNALYVKFEADGIITYIKNNPDGVMLKSDYSQYTQVNKYAKIHKIDAKRIAEFIKSKQKVDAKESYTAICMKLENGQLTATLYMIGMREYPTRSLKIESGEVGNFELLFDQRFLLDSLNIIGDNDFSFLVSGYSDPVFFNWHNTTSILMPLYRQR